MVVRVLNVVAIVGAALTGNLPRWPPGQADIHVADHAGSGLWHLGGEEAPSAGGVISIWNDISLSTSIFLAWTVMALLIISGALAIDDLALVLDMIFAVAAIATVLLSWRAHAATSAGHGEYYSLLLFSVMGMAVLVSAQNLITLFIGIELLSIPLYVLCATEMRREHSLEAGLKYLIVGSVGSATLLYGVAMLYGATGQTDFAGIAHALSRGGLSSDPLTLTGIDFVWCNTSASGCATNRAWNSIKFPSTNTATINGPGTTTGAFTMNTSTPSPRPPQLTANDVTIPASGTLPLLLNLSNSGNNGQRNPTTIPVTAFNSICVHYTAASQGTFIFSCTIKPSGTVTGALNPNSCN